MSSIASLFIVKVSDLPAIVNAAGSARAWEAIRQFGEELDKEYNWSGSVLLDVLTNLDELNIPLMSPEMGEASAAINATFDDTTLIASDAKAYLDRLQPAAYQPGDLLDGPELGLDEEETGHAVAETLSLLHGAIAALSDNQILLVHIS